MKIASILALSVIVGAVSAPAHAAWPDPKDTLFDCVIFASTPFDLETGEVIEEQYEVAGLTYGIFFGADPEDADREFYVPREVGEFAGFSGATSVTINEDGTFNLGSAHFSRLPNANYESVTNVYFIDEAKTFALASAVGTHWLHGTKGELLDRVSSLKCAILYGEAALNRFEELRK
jgi:hypothetical protein